MRLMLLRSSALLLALTALTACSTPQKNSTATTADAESSAPAPEQVTTLKAVALSGALPYSAKNGEQWEGLAHEVLSVIQAELGGDAAPDITEVTSIKAAGDALKDASANIACGVGFSWDRAEQLSYSLPFALGGVRLLTTGDNDGTPEALSGKSIGVIKDSIPADVVAKQLPETEVTQFDSPAAALDALKQGTVDAVANGALWAKANADAVPGSKVVPERPYGRSAIACVVNPENHALLAKANVAIAQLLQRYIDGDEASTKRINLWIGPDSAVGLSAETIATYYNAVLSTVTGIDTQSD
jgi:polar amino acid transport system substrate-binding protein